MLAESVSIMSVLNAAPTERISLKTTGNKAQLLETADKEEEKEQCKISL